MRTARTIVLSGLTIAVLDGLDAVVATWWFGGSPARMFQGIAGGLLGREAALAGGTATVALGVACHLLVATAVAAIYLGASRKLPVLADRPFACGALYGLGVWAVMRWGVVPLSALGPMRPLTAFSLVNGVLAHVLLVGVPAALFARHARARGVAERRAPALAARPAGSGGEVV